MTAEIAFTVGLFLGERTFDVGVHVGWVEQSMTSSTIARDPPKRSAAALFTILFRISVGFHDGFADRMAAAIPATSDEAKKFTQDDCE